MWYDGIASNDYTARQDRPRRRKERDMRQIETSEEREEAHIVTLKGDRKKTMKTQEMKGSIATTGSLHMDKNSG